MLEICFSKKHLERFKEMKILAVYLFGSQAAGETYPLSDVDIGVIFLEPEKCKDETLELYTKLYDIFTEVLPKDYLRERFKRRKHEFDLVFLQCAPIHLQFQAVRNSEILYESHVEKKLDYEEYVIKRYCDLRYFYDLHYNAIMERL